MELPSIGAVRHRPKSLANAKAVQAIAVWPLAQSDLSALIHGFDHRHRLKRLP